jgi:hypothetical protein
VTAIRQVSLGWSALAVGLLFVLAGCATAPSVAPSIAATDAVPATPGATITPGASPTGAGSATQAPSQVPPPATFSWTRIGTIPTLFGFTGIASSPAGYVVLESRTVWFSTDGRMWTKSVLPFTSTTSNGVQLRAHVNAIAGGPGGFVVVGGYEHAPCSSISQGDGGPPACQVGPISWSSADGRNWKSSQPTHIPADGSALPAYDEIVGVWPAGDGWDAAVEARDSVLYHGNTMLHTVDGRTWNRLAPGPLPPGATTGDGVYAHGGVASTDGRRIEWQTRDKDVATESTLATSIDGSHWVDVPSFAGEGAYVGVLLGPEAGKAGPWLVLGNSSTSGRWWRSNDLVTWQMGATSFSGIPQAGIGALARLGDGYIALGVEQLEDYTTIRITLLSPDGATWTFVDATAASPEPAPEDAPALMADGPAGLLGIGNVDTSSTIWLGVDLGR